jgi:hypothetical protein
MGELQPAGVTCERLEERLPGEMKPGRRRTLCSFGKAALN